MKRLPALLTSAREATGLNQSQAARLLRVAQPTISHWESGVFTPTLSMLRRVATKYGVGLDEFMPAWLAAQSSRPVRGRRAS